MVVALGDIRFQFRWLQKVAFAFAGVQIFAAFPGEVESVVSNIARRIVLSFNVVTTKIWNFVGDFVEVDFSGFEGQLTFSMLVLSPYLFSFRHVRIESPLVDENRILALLNFLSFVFVSSVFNSVEQYKEPRAFEVAISVAPLLLVFMCLGFYGLFVDVENRVITRLVVIWVVLSLLLLSVLNIVADFAYLKEADRPFVFVFVSLTSSFAYACGLMFRINGRYPLLACVMFYLFYFVFDKILLWGAATERLLSSWGVPT